MVSAKHHGMDQQALLASRGTLRGGRNSMRTEAEFARVCSDGVSGVTMLRSIL